MGMKTKTGTIYCIFCTKNGKVYIGQTWGTLKHRWSQHCYKGAGTCLKLKNAISKYGKGAFVISSLTVGLTTQEDMNSAEKYWISYFDSINNGYNIENGGNSVGKHSEETKRKIGDANRGKIISKEVREKMSEIGRLRFPKGSKTPPGFTMSGKKHSESTKSRMRESALGRKMSNEARAKLSKSLIGNKCAKRRKIIDNNGVMYDSIADAAKALGVGRTSISNILAGNQGPTKSGYTFMYADTEIENICQP